MEWMTNSQTYALLILAAAVIWVGFQLRGIRRAMGDIPIDPLDRIRDQTLANKKLIGTPDGQEVLVEFALSEAALAHVIDQIGEQTSSNPETNTAGVRKKISELFQTTKDIANFDVGKWAVAGFRKYKGWLGRTIFKKANDIVKDAAKGFLMLHL